MITLDIAILAIFLLITLIVGMGHGRQVKSIKDYALGGKNFSTTTAGSLSGYFWQTKATRMAQLMPPKSPSTLLYNPLHRAHFLIALKATLNTL